MQPQTDGEYQKLLSDVIKKQIIILGPTITIAKARNVSGLTVSDDGTVTAISGNPQEITQHLVEQFMELSGLIVKKTMEPLLASYPGLAVATQTQQATGATTPSEPLSMPSSTQNVVPPLPTSSTPENNPTGETSQTPIPPPPANDQTKNNGTT